MRALLRDEQHTAWELRGAWAAHKRVVVTLTDRCMVQRIEGLIEHVAVTGAFVVIDGWHIPTVDVTGVHKPHFTQEEATAA